MRVPFSALLLSICSLAGLEAQEGEGGAKALTTADVFNTPTIWTVHLQFTPEEWQSMEPKDGGRGPMGMAGGRGGASRFGPSMILAPSLMARGDPSIPIRRSSRSSRGTSITPSDSSPCEAPRKSART